MATLRSTINRLIRTASSFNLLQTDHEINNSTSIRLAKGRIILGIATMILALLQIVLGRGVGSSDIDIDDKNCTVIFGKDCCLIPEFGWDSWNGMVVFITGLLGVFCHKSRSKLVTLLVTAIVAATTSAFFTTWLVIDMLTNTDQPSHTEFILMNLLFVELVCCILVASFTCGPICYMRQIVFKQNQNTAVLQTFSNERTATLDSSVYVQSVNDYDLSDRPGYSSQVYNEIDDSMMVNSE